MKKIKIILLMIILIANFSFIGCKKTEKIILKIGMISDIHCTNVTNWNDNFKKALQNFKENKVDSIVIAGDIVDKAFNTNYSIFTNTFNSVFSKDAPKLVLTMGNHDFWKVHGSSSPKKEMYDLFEKSTGQSPNYHTIIKGYHFIAVSPDNGELNYRGQVDWLKNELDIATKNNNKPVFVIAHTNGVDTIPGGASAELNDVLKNYAQAVLLSGHTHYSIFDERSIFQDNYTSIELGSVAYNSVYETYENEPPTTGARQCFGLIAEVKKDKIDIKRIKLNDNTPAKDSWVINLPLSKDTFTYTSDKVLNDETPNFEASAKITEQCAENYIELTFDAARHKDMVYAYRITAVNVNNPEDNLKVEMFSDFYNGVKEMSKTLTIKLKNLTVGQTYAITIKARSSLSNFSPIGITKNVTYSY